MDVMDCIMGLLGDTGDVTSQWSVFCAATQATRRRPLGDASALCDTERCTVPVGLVVYYMWEAVRNAGASLAGPGAGSLSGVTEAAMEAALSGVPLASTPPFCDFDVDADTAEFVPDQMRHMVQRLERFLSELAAQGYFVEPFDAHGNAERVVCNALATVLPKHDANAVASRIARVTAALYERANIAFAEWRDGLSKPRQGTCAEIAALIQQASVLRGCIAVLDDGSYASPEIAEAFECMLMGEDASVAGEIITRGAELFSREFMGDAVEVTAVECAGHLSGIQDILFSDDMFDDTGMVCGDADGDPMKESTRSQAEDALDGVKGSISGLVRRLVLDAAMLGICSGEGASMASVLVATSADVFSEARERASGHRPRRPRDTRIVVSDAAMVVLAALDGHAMSIFTTADELREHGNTEEAADMDVDDAVGMDVDDTAGPGESLSKKRAHEDDADWGLARHKRRGRGEDAPTAQPVGTHEDARVDELGDSEMFRLLVGDKYHGDPAFTRACAILASVARDTLVQAKRMC